MLIKSAKISTPFGVSPVSHNPRLGEPFGSADVVSRSITIIHSLLYRALPFDETSLTQFAIGTGSCMMGSEFKTTILPIRWIWKIMILSMSW